MTSSTALYSGARSAMKLSRACLREADDYGPDWRDKMISEAKRHKERAEFYLNLRNRKPINESNSDGYAI